MNAKKQITPFMWGGTLKIVTVIIMFILLSGVFYWFQYRPAEIRKECYSDVYKNYDTELKSVIENTDSIYGATFASFKRYQEGGNLREEKRQEAKENFVEEKQQEYENCLHKKGLE